MKRTENRFRKIYGGRQLEPEALDELRHGLDQSAIRQEVEQHGIIKLLNSVRSLGLSTGTCRACQISFVRQVLMEGNR